MSQRLRRTFEVRFVDPDDVDDDVTPGDDDDGDEHAFPATISSDQPVPRQGPNGMPYREVLDHTPAAVDLRRAPLPFLESHNADAVNIGVVDSLRLEGGRLRGVVRLGKSARARELAADIRSRIVRSLSVGYQIHDATWDDDETLRATRWSPMEVSAVAVPADTNAGFYRSISMPDNTEQRPSRQQRSAENDQRAMNAEIIRRASLHGMGSRAAEWIEQGLTLNDVNERILEHRSTAPTRQPAAEQFDRSNRERENVRSSPQRTGSPIPHEELRKYSLCRAMLGIMAGADARDVKAAGFEMEVSRTLQDHSGRGAKGIMIPDEIFFGSRQNVRAALMAGSGVGENLVATQLLSDEYITALANEPQVVALGARMLTGLVGNVTIPRETSGVAPTWAAEATDAGESEPVFDQPSMEPHDLSVTSVVSRRLLQQSTPAIDALVRTDIARYLNIGVDAAAINGSGSSNQPLGILGVSGVAVPSLGSNGGAPTWAALTQCVQDVASANALRGSLGWLVNGAVMGCLMRTPKIGSTFPTFLWEDGATPNEGSIAGFKARVSNSVPSNLTKAGGSSLSASLFGNWDDVLIGVWGGVDLIVDPYTLGKQGSLQITGFRTVDVLVRHGASFAVIKDMVTT